MAKLFEVPQSVKDNERKKEIDKFKHDQKIEVDKFKHDQKSEVDRLKQEIEQLKNLHQSKTKINNKKNETSIAVQLLILHYLGFLNQIKAKNNKAKAELLSKIFNTEGIENIRKGLSKTGGKNSNLLTKDNLELVCKIFETAGMEEQLKKAQKDLDYKLSKNKL
jgi:hypothetical protein